MSVHSKAICSIDVNRVTSQRDYAFSSSGAVTMRWLKRLEEVKVEPAIRSGLLEAQPNYAYTLMVSLNCLRYQGDPVMRRLEGLDANS